MKIVKFLQWECYLVFARYANGRLAIRLMDINDHDEVATATVNIPNVILAENEIIIKDYSENDGMLAALVYGGIVKNPHRYCTTGFVSCPICKLIINPEEYVKEGTFKVGLPEQQR
jgi:hypothetical protein